MKAIKYDKFIIRETGRFVDRDDDKISYTYKSEPEYGVKIDKDIRDHEYRFGAEIYKEEMPEIWERIKDTTRDELIEMYYNSIITLYDVYINFINAENDEGQLIIQTEDTKLLNQYDCDFDEINEFLTDQYAINPYAQELDGLKDTTPLPLQFVSKVISNISSVVDNKDEIFLVNL